MGSNTDDEPMLYTKDQIMVNNKSTSNNFLQNSVGLRDRIGQIACEDNKLIDSGHEDLKSLDLLLNNKKIKNKFKNFLISEYSDENLEFYEAVENLELQVMLQNVDFDLQIACQAVYKRFIEKNSLREINIDGPTRDDITDQLEKGNMDVNTFKSAKNKIYSLMASDSHTLD